jgi:predicted ATP-grasp superfamily ATP-dependent carboligase
MPKYETLNAATQKHIEWLEAEIFANREKLIIASTTERKIIQKSIAELSKDLAKNFARIEQKIVQKIVQKTVKKSIKKQAKKVKKINENERKFWE